MRNEAWTTRKCHTNWAILKIFYVIFVVLFWACICCFEILMHSWIVVINLTMIIKHPQILTLIFFPTSSVGSCTVRPIMHYRIMGVLHGTCVLYLASTPSYQANSLLPHTSHEHKTLYGYQRRGLWRCKSGQHPVMM